MSTPERASAAAVRLSAERAPIPRVRRAVEQDEGYDGYEAPLARRQRVGRAPQWADDIAFHGQIQGETSPSRSDGVLWGVVFLAIGVALGYLLITRGYIPIPMGVAQQPMPTAGIAPRPSPRPTPNDYGVGAYNATHAAPEALRATEAPPMTPSQEPAQTATEDTAQFWTEAEQAAFTATAVAFYDPATLPTAPPEFVAATLAGCADPELVAESPYLQLWCLKEGK